MSAVKKVLYVRKMLQLLHLTEYLLLIEFTEVMTPIGYCTWTVVILLSVCPHDDSYVY